MRNHSRVSPRRHTGKFGRSIRGETVEALRLQSLTGYLLDGPHTNALGLFHLPVGYVMADLEWSAEGVRETLLGLEERGLIRWNPETEWVWVKEHFRHQMGTDPDRQPGDLRQDGQPKKADSRIEGLIRPQLEEAEGSGFRDAFLEHNAELYPYLLHPWLPQDESLPQVCPKCLAQLIERRLATAGELCQACVGTEENAPSDTPSNGGSSTRGRDARTPRARDSRASDQIPREEKKRVLKHPQTRARARPAPQHRKPELVYPPALLQAIPDFPATWSDSRELRDLEKRVPLKVEQRQLEALAEWIPKYGPEEVLAEVKRASDGYWQSVCYSPPRPGWKPKNPDPHGLRRAGAQPEPEDDDRYEVYPFEEAVAS